MLTFPLTPDQENPMSSTDLTTRDGVAALMRSSKSEEEWNANCDKVKAANQGYPDFWYATVILSGLAGDTQRSWR
jgi:hypothetical protein